MSDICLICKTNSVNVICNCKCSVLYLMYHCTMNSEPDGSFLCQKMILRGRFYQKISKSGIWCTVHCITVSVFVHITSSLCQCESETIAISAISSQYSIRCKFSFNKYYICFEVHVIFLPCLLQRWSLPPQIRDPLCPTRASRNFVQ